ncbi:MAG: extracellular solute-binding protein [Anaerolineae bacterium]|jgi:multiple sugar transport system substrate-binding protein
MKKKGLVLLLGLIIIVSGWRFIDSRSLAQPEKGTVDVWATWGDDPAQLQGLLERFSQSNGVAVRVTTQVRSEDLQKALTGTRPPDLVILSNGDLIGAYQEKGFVEQMDRWIDATGIALEDIYPAALKQCQELDGATLCLPWGCDIDALFWNKDLFEAAGLDPERPPQTMEELVEYAAKLTLRDEEGELSQVGFIPNFARSHTDLYARMFGSGVHGTDGTQLAMNSQPVIEALNWQKQFYTICSPKELEDLVPRAASRHAMYAGRRLDCQQCHRTSDIASTRRPNVGFLEGQVAMMVNGQWQANLDAVRQESWLHYGVAAFPPPAAHGKRASTSVVQGPVVFIPAGALDKAAAANLLAWMMSPEVVADAAYANRTLPPSRAAARDIRFQSADFKVFIDLLAHPNAQVAVKTPIHQELNQVLEQIEEEVLHKGSEPVPLVNEAQTELALELGKAHDSRGIRR